MKQPVPKEIIFVAIMALIIIELTALVLGFNGQLMRFVCVIIAGLAGWTVPNLQTK